MDVQKKILSLIKEIDQHNIDYYVHDNPKISDSEYDKLLRELQNIENQYPNLISDYSPTKRVGSKPASKFDSIDHSVPMLSLANAMNHDELIDFAEGLKLPGSQVPFLRSRIQEKGIFFIFFKFLGPAGVGIFFMDMKQRSRN